MTLAAQKALDAIEDPRMRNAVIGYAEGKSIGEAMTAAGYSRTYAKTDGPARLLANPRFNEAYVALTAPTIIARVNEIEATANESLFAMAAIVHADPGLLTDENHVLLPLRKMPALIRRAIQSVRFDAAGKLVGVGLASKPQALLMLARSQNLLDQPIPPPPPGETRVAGLDHAAAVDLLARQSPHLLDRPVVAETAAKAVNGNGKHNNLKDVNGKK